MRRFLARLIALFQRRRLDRELADEIAAHLEMAIADNRARGLSPEEARRVAMTAFGGVLQTEEAYRDWTMLVVPIGLAALSGLLCGLPAALMVWRSRLNDTLKQDARNQSAGVSEQRLANLLMVGETALTVMLLIGAGLLIKSFIQLQRIDLGVNPRHAVTANLLLSKRYLDPARREAFARQMLDSVAALPGVLDAAVHTDPPFLGGGSQETFTVEDVADPSPDRGHVAGFDVVSGNFFGAMGMPIVRGRDFETLDTATAPPVAMALLGTFAVIALIIATAGIYGLSTYAVVRRRQELGIRLALGATPGQILVLVIRHGMFLNLVGAALGLAAAMMLGKTVAGFLYGITATDAPTFLAVLLLFAAVALVATYLPARLAATIHPSLAFPT